MEADSPSRGAVVVSGLVMSGMLCGALTGQAALARAHDPYAQLDLFARVFTTVQKDYVDEVPPARLVEGAIAGMLETLDPQSRWLSARQLQELQDDAAGTTTGIGVSVRRTENGVEVVEVLPDSPALRDGLAPGDRILAVDGTPLAALSARELPGLFEGLDGQATSLTILRPGALEPVVITTVRASVERPAVEAERLGTVIYARIDHFQSGVADDLSDLVEARGPGTATGLVLDLRDNPGGLLSEAVAVSDLFLDDGVIVATRARPDSVMDLEEHRASRGGFRADLPVVVLVNGLSASASEIVASALQDTGRATLVGETTYGKGSVQKVYTHLDPSTPDAEAALKLTVGWYTTPSGQPVAAHEGRTPDVVVRFPREAGPKKRVLDAIEALSEQIRSGSMEADAQQELDARVDALRRLASDLPDDPNYRADLPWDLPLTERVPRDPQLQKALELLKG